MLKCLLESSVVRGDVIIAKSPFDPSMNICKRVVGLEGDKVRTSGASALFQTHTYVSTSVILLPPGAGTSIRLPADGMDHTTQPFLGEDVEKG